MNVIAKGDTGVTYAVLREGEYRPECGTWLTDEQFAAWKAGGARYRSETAAIESAMRKRIGYSLASACWWSLVLGKEELPPDTWWAE